MTAPTSSRAGRPMSFFVNRWLVPLVTFGFGVVVLVAMATDDDLAEGLAWFAVIAAATLALAEFATQCLDPRTCRSREPGASLCRLRSAVDREALSRE